MSDEGFGPEDFDEDYINMQTSQQEEQPSKTPKESEQKAEAGDDGE